MGRLWETGLDNCIQTFPSGWKKKKKKIEELSLIDFVGDHYKSPKLSGMDKHIQKSSS